MNNQICYTQLPMCDGCPCHTICHGYDSDQIQLENTDDELYQIEVALENMAFH